MEDKTKSGKLSIFVEFGAFKQLPKNALSVFAKENNSILKLLLRTSPYNKSLEVEIGEKRAFRVIFTSLIVALTTPLSGDGEPLIVQRVRQNVFQLQAPLEENAPSVSSGAIKVSKVIKRPGKDFPIGIKQLLLFSPLLLSRNLHGSSCRRLSIDHDSEAMQQAQHFTCTCGPSCLFIGKRQKSRR